MERTGFISNNFALRRTLGCPVQAKFPAKRAFFTSRYASVTTLTKAGGLSGSLHVKDDSKVERGKMHGQLPPLVSKLRPQLQPAISTVTALPRLRLGRRRIRCSSSSSSSDIDSDSLAPATDTEDTSSTTINTLLKVLKNANALLPYAVALCSVSAFVFPPTFTWFRPRYYAPALGFLMFAVGINLSATSFIEATKRPAVIAVGYGGQYLIKPMLGLFVAYIAVSLLHLPPVMGSGLLLVACVSGAQLSNYATFMVDPGMAPLSIVMTALSTITAVVVTPALSLLLLGKVLPINVAGMMASITQIVVFPIATGLCLNKFLPSVSSRIRPFLPFCAVLTTCCCVGSPLAVNIESLRSQMGLILLLPIIIFHTLAFIVGYQVTELLFRSEPDVGGLSRTISFETGMQSSLLALALANNFFDDPLMCLPPAISTVLMSLMGFGLTIIWQQKKSAAHAA